LRIKPKYNIDDVSLEELNLRLPDRPFIAFFGSSHTYGQCKRGDGWAIDEDKVYANILGKKFGLPIVNFSIPGNYNLRIQQQVLDFLELSRSSHCVKVIIEVRLADHSYYFGRDIFVDDFYTEPNNPELAGGSEFWYKTFWDNMYTNYVRSKDNDYSYLNERISNLKRQSGYQPIDAELDTLKELSKTFTLTRFCSVQQLLEDLYTIRVLQRLCRLANIPFHWFCWDERTSYLLDQKLVNHIEEVFRKNTKIYEDQLLYPNMKNIIKNEKGYQFIEENRCVCGHLDETVHEWLADKLYNELNDRN